MRALVASQEDGASALSFDEVYERYVAFVWRVLRALGVPASHLEDAAQDVFVVVHRRLHEFERRSALSTWLFAITRRVASRHRQRHAAASHTSAIEAEPMTAADPFADVVRAEASAKIAAILERMDEDKRLVFTLVELEQLSVAEVARTLGINQNTAHSRLRLARAEFAAAARKKGAP
jgi:RNA polymerase sigma-70 factor (ECF subfamily)